MAPSDLASFLAGEPPAEDAPVADRASAPPGVAPRPAADAPSPRPVDLHGRFQIDPARPIPELRHAGADAFAATRLEPGSGEVFAYVCHSGLPARTDSLTALRAIDHDNILNLIGHGVVDWPPDGVERLILIYERPARRLVASPGETATPLREDDVVRTLVAPVAAALEKLKQMRIVHGAINPSNLFVQDQDGQGLLLGDCMTAPTGFLQPAAFETIGRAMATPAGRGVAAHSDDLYALGASMIFMLLGRMPGGGLDDDTLIAAKIESGSFAALVGDDVLPQNITEPVRGLLVDDPQQRWTLDDLQTWLGGRRQSPRRTEIVGRLRRPMRFGDLDHLNVRTLAAAMAKDTAAADKIIGDGSLEDDLRRSAVDDELRGRVAEAKRTASLGRSGVLLERRVARVLMALDPQAPIRYRGRSVMPEGIGPALAEAVATGDGLQELAEILANKLPIAWIGFQGAESESLVPLVRQFDTLSGYVGESGLGHGVERCLYELEPSAPCAGHLTRGRHVLDAKSFLLALEEAAARPDRPREPIDRHAAAFLMARHGRLIDRPIKMLSGDATPGQRCAALVDLYDVLQRRTEIAQLPRLCQWLASLAEPAIAAHHSRSLRNRLTAEVGKVWKGGRVCDLKALLCNTVLTERDAGGFRAAIKVHALAARSIAARRRELERKAEIASAQGRQAAAIIASLLSVMMAVGTAIMALI